MMVLVTTLHERMKLDAAAGITDEGQGGTSAAGAEHQWAPRIALFCRISRNQSGSDIQDR